ncbi:MAG: PAS domain S-box protein [Dehalococcoidales bacterium]
MTLDIDARKRAEDIVKITLNRFYSVLSEMPLGILLVNRDGLTEFANPTFCEMFDLKQSPEEVRNIPAGEVIKKIQNVYENPEQAVARITEIVNRGEPVKDEEVPLQDGRVVLRDFVPIWLEENRYGRLWIHRDITERKKMEDALKESEAKANALIKYAPTAIYELDYRIPRITNVNEAVSNMSGYTREELLSMNPTDLMDEDSKNRFAERMKSILAGKKIDETVDFRIKKKDGSFMYTTLNVSLSPEKPFTALVIAHDITERKRSEIEISRLSQQRQLALDAAQMGWWQYDPATQIATYDEGYQRIFGVSGSQRPNEEILKRLHPDDLPQVRALVEAALNPADPQSYSARYRIFLDDGAVRWIEAHGIATFEGEGSARRAASLIGTVADITERVQADEKLKDSQKQLLDIIDGAPNSIFVKDLQGRFITINAQLEKLLGKTREAIKGKTDYDIISGDQAANYRDNDRRIAENDKPEQLEEEADLADGRHHYFLANKFPLHDIHGKTYAVASVSTDLTEFRQAEKAVRESEEKFSKIFHSSPVGMVMTHLPEGRCVDVNEAYLKMLEYRREEIIGRDSRDLNMHINPNKRDEIFRLLREQGKVSNIELSFRTKTGRIIELLSSIDRINLQGQEYSLSTNIDITARKQAEAEVVHLASFPEYNPMPIVEVSSEGDVIYANPSARLRFPLMIHGQKRKFLIDFINIVRDSETSVAVKDVYIDENWYEETMAYVASTNTYRLYAREITLRKKFEDELKQRTVDLEASNKELEAFSYSVSHDLRAPLRSITGFSTILLEDYQSELDKEGKTYLKKISDSGELMGQLMDDLLKLSRVTRSDLNIEKLDLSDMARNIVDELRNDDPKRKVKIVIAPNMTASGDRNLLGLVLQNLLGNAWKYSSKTAEPLIEMGTLKHNGKRAYFVRDNGVGFDMTYADKLFKPFQRLHKATEFAGTGIGLATVQRIIRRHGGEVWAESKVGEGATFYFTLN